MCNNKLLATIPFSSKFEIGREYKTRDGAGPFELIVIVPEAEFPLIFLNRKTGLYHSRYKDGRQFSSGVVSSDDMTLHKRTVYVNLFRSGHACWYDTAKKAAVAGGENDDCLKVAVPVDIEG